ncbi:MAG: hypothetical protein HQ559_01745 [Lentisphaerae bacterium]|nr:hypothetical protein [Lentisphaerota bacterium]
MSINDERTRTVVDEVRRELLSSIDKFGWQEHLSLADHMNIIVEELGEVAREQNEIVLGNKTFDQVRDKIHDELIQVAAMAGKMAFIVLWKEAER